MTYSRHQASKQERYVLALSFKLPLRSIMIAQKEPHHCETCNNIHVNSNFGHGLCPQANALWSEERGPEGIRNPLSRWFTSPPEARFLPLETHDLASEGNSEFPHTFSKGGGVHTKETGCTIRPFHLALGHLHNLGYVVTNGIIQIENG